MSGGLSDRAEPGLGRAAHATMMREQPDANEQLVLSTMRAQEAAERAAAAQAAAEFDRARLFEHAGWGVAFVCDTDNRLLAVNPALAAMHGYTVDELVGAGLEVFCPPSARAQLAEDVRLLHEKGHHLFDGTHARKDGSVFPCLTEATRSTDRSGKRTASAYNFQDVSERTQLKARLAVSDRLAALDTMSAGVAHEINNPLTCNLTSIEYVTTELPVLLEDIKRVMPDGDPTWSDIEQRAEHLLAVLAEAQEGAHRIARIVATMKTFVRPLDQRFEVAELPKVLEAAMRICHDQCVQRAKLVADFRQVPRVRCNSGQLGQVFTNLLVNAMQAIAPGAPEANEIRVVLDTDAAGKVVVEVRDTGCGMSAQTIREMYDPFFTTKPVGVGTGLGLSISHGIVVAHDGEMTVESEVGKGTSFRIRLPPVEPTQKEGPGEPVPAPAASVVTARVLVIDDDENVGRALQRILGRHHQVVLLSSAGSAVALLDAGALFDVVFCDLMMPEMTGMDFHDWVTKHRPALCKRLVFITGGAVGTRSQEFIERMADPVVEKPFDRSVIAARIAKILESFEAAGKTGC